MKQILEFFRNVGATLSRVFGPSIERFHSAHRGIQRIALGVCVLIFLTFFISFLVHSGQVRRVYYFPDAQSGKPRAEARYLPRQRGVEASLVVYVRELILGPMNPNAHALFNRGTHLSSCFLRDGAVYADLSAEALFPEKGVAEIREAVFFLKKNVCTNFRNVDKIYLYIDGEEVYRDDPVVAPVSEKQP